MTSPIAISELQRFVEACLLASRLSETDARLTADALVTTDAMGIFTHGTKLLAGYIKKLQGGGYLAKARPRIEREGPAWAVVDGESALGQVGSDFAMRLAIQKSREVGVAWVGLRN